MIFKTVTYKCECGYLFDDIVDKSNIPAERVLYCPHCKKWKTFKTQFPAPAFTFKGGGFPTHDAKVMNQIKEIQAKGDKRQFEEDNS